MAIGENKEQSIIRIIEQTVIDDAYWISRERLVDEMNISELEIQDMINDSLEIVVNSDGDLTTRKLYKERSNSFCCWWLGISFTHFVRANSTA